MFWELDPVSGGASCDAGSAELDKEAWVSDTLLEWGSCGQFAYVDGVPAGYMLYAPPAYVPRSVAFPTSPVSSDAVLLMTARLMPEFSGAGLGRMLVQAVARDAARRGIKAIEAFGRATRPHREAPAEWAARAAAARRRSRSPIPARRVPAAQRLPAGGRVQDGAPAPATPRLRLDIKTTVSWQEDVEYALERLLGSCRRRRWRAEPGHIPER